MLNYILRRLFLLPLTLFCIILVNFVIINMAPGDPVTVTEVSQEGATRREELSGGVGADDSYFQFREFYGLTLPIMFNLWPNLSKETVHNNLHTLLFERELLSVRKYNDLRIRVGDQARFVMPQLFEIATNTNEKEEMRNLAVRLIARGGTQMAHIGTGLTKEQRAANQQIAADNQFLKEQLALSRKDLPQAIHNLQTWFQENRNSPRFVPFTTDKIQAFFVETRLFRYLSRVLTLNFGTMRNDNTKTVVREVTKRFKYSLTLSIIPMFITFFLCQLFGFTMAIYQNRLPDFALNVFFLILFAIPVFVVAPFLIEKVALNGTFPFTNIPIPYSGFTSPEQIYKTKTSLGRLLDTMQHLALPLIAVMYGSLASSSRLSRTAVLEVARQDYVRTARAKGAAPLAVWGKHVGRNAAITIVTSLAGSLGIILGGSLIVETLFQIDGFGKFFYDAIINRDYNVIMFSAIAGSFLTLVGYLTADLAYTILDPRVTLD